MTDVRPASQTAPSADDVASSRRAIAALAALGVGSLLTLAACGDSSGSGESEPAAPTPTAESNEDDSSEASSQDEDAAEGEIGADNGEAEEATPPSTAAPTSAPEPTTSTTMPAPTEPEAFPAAPATPEAALTLLVDAEAQIADPTIDSIELINASRRQQVAYRAIGANPEWDETVLAGVTDDRRQAVVDHLAARRAFISMHTRLSDTLPAWRLVAPEPKEDLLAYYRKAEAETGIEWEYLAAINLVESGLGRIQGLSTAGAQGPMQFLPSTWEAYAEGDIEDPHDAIIGAGMYLAASGGPEDMDQAIWHYNHHDGYVSGVKQYAKILRDDPAAYDSLYHWEIVFASTEGEVHMPVGYLETEPIAVTEYLAGQ